MKKSYLLILVCLVTVVPAFSQERPRFFDNFDTARGVQVYRPPAPSVQNARTVAVRTPGKSSDKKLVKKTVQSRMSADDSYALKDVPRAAAKLTMGTSSHMNGFTTG